MKITVLGSASGMAVPHRNASAYLLEVERHLYLIDAGDGVSQQLVRFGVDHNKIDCVLISHTHPDHAAGLFALLQLMHLTGRRTPLRIYLPQGVLPGFNSIFPYFHIFREKWPFRFELIPISKGTLLEEDGLRISAIPNGHLSGGGKIAEKSGVGSDSYSFRFTQKEDGEVIYTSDVDSLAHLNENTSRVDLLISECYHVSVEEVRDYARSAGINRVILTHIRPEWEGVTLSAKQQQESPVVEFANDGHVIEV